MDTWEKKISILNTKIGDLNKSLKDIASNLTKLETRIDECEKERERHEKESRAFRVEADGARNIRNKSAILGAFKLGAGSGGSMAVAAYLAPLTARKCAAEAVKLENERDEAQLEKNEKKKERDEYAKTLDNKNVEVGLLKYVSEKLDSIKTNIQSIVTTAENRGSSPSRRF
ncbi:hypothetical protein MAR_033421 [Mya arenaria]|uniref:Uncharacterized protein n=1 Tax=Mya arenaria TaxID=6604 RepID=A0ABY7GBY8_MYAAR|nr:hypothetical protein MAR_033421 [Mya arenaria]